MDQAQLTRSSSFVSLPAIDTIRIVALYDSMGDVAYAHEAIGSIAIAGHPEIKVASLLWSFDMLTRLDIRHASIHSAVEADVFIIAAPASSPLPVHVSSWLDSVLQERRRGAPVIVAIYEEDHRQAYELPALRRDLLAFAARWRAPLLCNRELYTRLEGKLQTRVIDAGERHTVGFDPDTLLMKSGRAHWGINE
jgi:hypothetical protein